MSKLAESDVQELLEAARSQSPYVEDAPLEGDTAVRPEEPPLDERILISISSTINTMAEQISDGERQKSFARQSHMRFFKWTLGLMLGFTALLITFNGSSLHIGALRLSLNVPVEIFISVIVVILADIVAIIHSFVKYMNNVEHYSVYNGLIDSLLKHISRKD